MLADTRPPGAWEVRPLRDVDLRLCRTSAAAIERSWSGFSATGWTGAIDGAQFVVERGIDGDHRFIHGDAPDRSGAPSAQTRAIHHLSPDARVLQLAPTNASDELWWRVVLDSVLFTVALLQGYEALHAAAIATPAGAIAIMAASGAGKSTLLAELLGRGHRLLADDVLVLELDSADARRALAHPAPPLMTVPARSDGRPLEASQDEPARTIAQQAIGWRTIAQPTSAQQAIAQQAITQQTIAQLDGERWIGVRVHPERLPVKALVLLDRRQGSPELGREPSLTRIENPLAPLLGSLMGFPRTPERERARFELASTLAGEASIWRLTADRAAPVSALADVLLAGEL